MFNLLRNLFFIACIVLSFSNCTNVRANKQYEKNTELVSFLDSLNKQPFIPIEKKEDLNAKHLPFLYYIDSLIQEDFQSYNHLVEVQFSNRFGDTNIIVGFLKYQKQDSLVLFMLSGGIRKFNYNELISAKHFQANWESLSNLKQSNVGGNYNMMRIPFFYFNIVKWLKQKEDFGALNLIMDSLENKINDKETIQYTIGHHYFNKLLSAFSVNRDFAEARKYARFFESPAFEGFEYRHTALRLGRQLNKGKINYASLPLVSSTQWHKMKTNMSREDQMGYLINKLHLLNYFQMGQPGGISYDMPQTAVPFSVMLSDSTIKDEKDYKKYYVINPFNEIIALKPTIEEAVPLVDLLLDSTYLLAYTYHRDFFAERTVHQVNWVVNDLLFIITKKRFVNNYDFGKLSVTEQSKIITDVKKWFDENKNINKQERYFSILKETKKWNEFGMILDEPDLELNQKTLDLIVSRRDDFDVLPWESSNSIQAHIAKLIFRKGDDKQAQLVNQWMKGAKDDYNLKLWSALYLIKIRDKNYYSSAFDELKELLRQCDGITIYPYTIDVLLATKDSKAIQLAEGILQKPMFIQFLGFSKPFSNILKKLLLAKSETSYNFLDKSLRDKSENTQVVRKDRQGNKISVLNAEPFVMAIESWRNETQKSDGSWTNTQKLKYNSDLADWLKQQFDIINKDGKSSIIIDEDDNADFPSWQLDAARH